MSEHEIWEIKLPAGETRSGTLEQLDEAFSAGAIDERTLVRRQGTTEWITLAEAAGLDVAPPPAAVAVPPVSAPPPAITTDLDLEIDENALRAAKKKSLAFAAAGALAVIALAGVFVVRAGSAVEPSLPAAAAAPPPVAADLAAQAARTEKADDTATPQRTLTDDQKKALLQADQQRQDEARKKALSRPRAMPTVPSKSPFHKGGDKYDPLNSSL